MLIPNGEKSLSRWILAIQIIIIVVIVAAVFVPMLAIIVGLLGLWVYLATQKRDRIRAEEMRKSIIQEARDDGSVTINGKPVIY